MSRSRKLWPLLVLALTLLAAFVLQYWFTQRALQHAAESEQEATGNIFIGAGSPVEDPVKVAEDAEESAALSPLAQRIADVAEQLRVSEDVQANATLLEQLRGELEAADAATAIAAIREYLATGADAETRLPFQTWQGGVLRFTPTLRVFLLDQLGRMDPASAAEEAAVVFKRMDSADEWAVSLRNTAWAEGRSDRLYDLTRQMLTHEPWVADPTRGFLEAFDLIVYNDDVPFAPVLTSYIDPEASQALNHAGFMTLDRLVINEPVVAFDWMLQNLGTMDERPFTRAGFFARADMSDPTQKQQLESYLIDPSIANEEIEYFYNLFPNNNLMLSYNLLTPTEGIAHETIISRLDSGKAALLEWLNNERMPPSHQPHIEEALQRLEEMR